MTDEKELPPELWASLKGIPTNVLEYELRRRESMRRLGLCEHCERSGDAKACDKPGAHERAAAFANYARMLIRLNFEASRD